MHHAEIACLYVDLQLIIVCYVALVILFLCSRQTDVKLRNLTVIQVGLCSRIKHVLQPILSVE